MEESAILDEDDEPDYEEDESCAPVNIAPG